MGKNAVIFDFDGVLADTGDMAYRILCRIAARKGVPAPELEFLRNTRSQDVQRALGIRWWEAAFFLALGRKWLAEERSLARVFPWALELIRVAQAHSSSVMILSSNSPENIIAILQREGLAGLGLEIHGNVGMFGKARALRRLVSRYQLAPEKVIYIGDESRDIEAALAAGVRPVGVTWGYHSRELLEASRADRLLETPGDLEALLKCL